MKSYDEVTNNLLERRERYIADQMKKRKRVIGIAASLGCFGLVVLFGFGLLQGITPDMKAPDQTIGGAAHLGVMGDAGDHKGVSPDNKIIVHSITGNVSSDMAIALMCNDFVEMSREEMILYYGVDFVPVVPTDLCQSQGELLGIYRRDRGNGDVYWDQNRLSYANEDASRTVCVEINKGDMPFRCCIFYDSTLEKSVINGIEVSIGQVTDGFYFAEFIYNNAGFIISANGLTQEEFVMIIASVLK